MDGVLLQTKVYAGFAKAAKRIGTPFDIYRPTTAFNPLAPANMIGTTPAAFTPHGPSNFDFTKPSDWQKPSFHALLDPTQVIPGDYLVSETPPFGPFFICSKDPAVPVLAVQCNRTISAFTPGPAPRPLGASSYGGSTLSNETALLTAWPCSILLGSRGIRNNELPGDAGYGSWRILLPPSAVVSLRPGTIVTDDLDNRFVIQSAELQDLGWRIDAQQAVT